MDIVLALNIAAALLLSAYALHQGVLLILFLRSQRSELRRRTPQPDPTEAEATDGVRLLNLGRDSAATPRVTVQLPLFNERFVAERAIVAVCALDYPHDALDIQILDDSTDDTRHIAERAVSAAQRRGLRIEHIQRDSRAGFKAGALANGLRTARGEYVAIFDADFVPRPDFLRRVVGRLQHAPEKVGFAQTRWCYQNRDDSAVTRGQAMMLDMHFVTEQTARDAGRLLMNFNGSGGVWRRACIEDAGGWQSDCLSEDLDLSFRAELRGWRGMYLNDIESPSELPDSVLAFKRQQARWARGSAQVIRKLGRDIARAQSLSPLTRVMGLLHISGYAIHIFILVLAVTAPWLALAKQQLPIWLGLVNTIGLAPLLSMYAASRWQGRGNARFARDIPFAVMLGIGLSVSNAAGLLQGFFKRDLGEFTRTPKLDDVAQRNSASSGYSLAPDWTLAAEALIGVGSALATAALVANEQFFGALIAGLYAFCFGGVALLQLGARGRAAGWISRRASSRVQSLEGSPVKPSK